MPQASAGAGFFLTAVRRAFRLRIDPSEVLASERAAMLAAAPPVVEPVFQAFLTWRRSLLFVVAVLLIPVVGFHVYDAVTAEEMPEIFTTMTWVQVATEVGFAVYAWILLGSWTRWTVNSRLLRRAWLVYFLAPFLTMLYPYRLAFEKEGMAMQGQGLLVGILFGVASMLTLAPKAFALLPGILRASLITKLLFPGSGAPGWLVTLLGPIYALLIYVLLVMPLQISGSGFFILAIIGLIGAQFFLARQGARLARPESYDEALSIVSGIRFGYMGLNAFGLLFVVIALFDLFKQMDLTWTTAVNLLLSLGANVLLLTLVATDLLIANLRRASTVTSTPESEGYRRAFEQGIAVFASDGPEQSSSARPH